MDPVTIAAVVSGISALGQLAAKLITSRGDDAAAALADMRTELGKLHAILDPGGDLDKALAAHDAALDVAIEAAKKPAP